MQNITKAGKNIKEAIEGTAEKIESLETQGFHGTITINGKQEDCNINHENGVTNFVDRAAEKIKNELDKPIEDAKKAAEDEITNYEDYQRREKAKALKEKWEKEKISFPAYSAFPLSTEDIKDALLPNTPEEKITVNPLSDDNPSEPGKEGNITLNDISFIDEEFKKHFPLSLKESISAMDLIESKNLNYHCGNALELIVYANDKPEKAIEVLKMAIIHLQREVERINGGNE